MTKRKKSLRLAIAPGTYDNDDAYERVLHYVNEKEKVATVNLDNETNLESIIIKYRNVQENALIQQPRYIWHGYITFDDHHGIRELQKVRDFILLLFGKYFQCLCSIDNYNNNHVHFAVNAYSYNTPQLILDNALMENHLHYLLSWLHNYYPAYKTTFNFRPY